MTVQRVRMTLSRNSLLHASLVLSVLWASDRAVASTEPCLVPSTADRDSTPVVMAGDPDFFCVRTRHCSQKRSGHGPSCCFVFERYLPDGQVRRSTQQSLLSWLKPGIPICIVIHGSFVADHERQEFVLANRWLRSGAPDKPLHVVFYRWPSHPGLKIVLLHWSIAELAHRAEFHGFYLAQFLSVIPESHPISLLGHSHGARTAASALHLIGGGRVQGMTLPPTLGVRHRYRLILGAAAIDHYWLNPGQKYGRAIPVCEGILNMRSRQDGLLNLYPIRKPFGHRALGESGFTPWDVAAIGRQSAKLAEMDVTPIVRTGHSYESYFPHQAIAAGFAPYVYFFDESLPSKGPDAGRTDGTHETELGELGRTSELAGRESEI